jgi:hypothetical protein
MDIFEDHYLPTTLGIVHRCMVGEEFGKREIIMQKVLG